MGAGKSKAKGKGDNEDNVEDIARNAPADQLIAAARDLPLCRGHPLLREFADALDREYVRREGGCCGDWLNGLSDERIRAEGVDVEAFVKWTEWAEAMIRRSYGGQMVMSIEQLRAEWGLLAAPPQGMPPQGMMPPQGTPAASSGMPPVAVGTVVQPGAGPVAVAQPIYGQVPGSAEMPVATAQPVPPKGGY